MITVTLIVLVVTLSVLWWKYRLKSFLHPATLFHIIWILSVLSHVIRSYVIVDQQYLNYIDTIYFNELMTYVIFTSLCVLFTVLFIGKGIKNKFTLWSPKIVVNDTIILLILTVFAISLYRLFTSGGLDVAAMRHNVLETSTQLRTGVTQLGPLAFVFNLIVFFNNPLLLYTGFLVSSTTFTSVRKKTRIIVYIPLLSGVINAFITGGRAAFIYVFVTFFIGYCLGFFRHNKVLNYEKTFKIVSRLLVFFIIFSSYSTFVMEQRKLYSSSGYQNEYSNFVFLKPFSGIIKYLSAHYPGYSLDRKFVVSKVPEPGKITLQGLTYFKVPFVSQILGEFSIRSLLDIPVTLLPYRPDNLYGGWSGTTSTVFINIYDDYGYTWSFFIILLFVLASQFFFIRMFRIPSKRIMFLFPHIVIYYLWYNSIFSHHLYGNWLTNWFLSYLFFDFMLNAKKRINYAKAVKSFDPNQIIRL